MTIPPAILVCDDEPVIRDTLAEFLQQEGYEVRAVGSGEQASFAHFRGEPFNIGVPLNIGVPRSSGTTSVSAWVRRGKSLPKLTHALTGC